MADALMLRQGTPFPDACMASPSWPIFMHNVLPRAQVAPPTTLSKRELLALQHQELQTRELEIEKKSS